jgi:prohibitin 2
MSMPDTAQVSVDLPTIRAWTITVACFVAGALLFFTRRPGTRFGVRRTSAAFACVAILLAVVLPLGLGRVQPGARGVVLRFGAPTGRIAGEGLYYVIPFAERVVQVNTQINTVRFDRAQATTRDLEPVYADLAASFHVEPGRVVEVYTNLRNDYAARVLAPAVEDAWKATAARYTASDLIAHRSETQRDFAEGVRSRVRPFGLTLDALATTRFNFSYSYAYAAQQKVASVQRTLEAQQDLQRIRFESQQSVIRARSEIEALNLQRNVPIADLIRLRQLDLQRRAIDKWDGKLPSATSTLPFLGPTLQPPHAD